MTIEELKTDIMNELTELQNQYNSVDRTRAELADAVSKKEAALALLDNLEGQAE